MTVYQANLTTKRWAIDHVAEIWKDRYYTNNGNRWSYNSLTDAGKQGDTRKVYEQLAALPAGATEDQVTAIIGNNSWTRLLCAQCGANSDALISLGELTPYSGRRTQICFACLSAGMELFSKHYGHKPLDTEAERS